MNIDLLFNFHPINNIGFGTITLLSGNIDHEEITSRLNSFLNFLRKSECEYIWVMHLRASRPHLHLLVLYPEDIQSGTKTVMLEMYRDMPLAVKKRYISPAALHRCEEFEEAAYSHGFGIAEMLPIWSDGERVRNYLTKEIWECRQAKDWLIPDGKKWWSCSANLRRAKSSARYNNKKYRQLCEAFCAAHGYESEQDVRQRLGPHFAWYIFEWTKKVGKHPSEG